jgi:hypothetical protein
LSTTAWWVLAVDRRELGEMNDDGIEMTTGVVNVVIVVMVLDVRDSAADGGDCETAVSGSNGMTLPI